MEKFEVDLDMESIWFGDAWRTRDDLAKEIRAKLEAGNYQIAQPSQAIEVLNHTINQMRVVSLRLSAEMAEALEAAGQEMGQPINAVIRQLVHAWLAQGFDEESLIDAEAIADVTPTEPIVVTAAPPASTPEESASPANDDSGKPIESGDATEKWFATGNSNSKKKKG
ncbi:MAG: ribbon-helix-helix protein, CopG family [Myxococcales bacterium]|jgi:uncharacterized protein (DUF4415 family)|nr:ribbon-helix-helix protein, CopG family [Myxococcales bacterium]